MKKLACLFIIFILLSGCAGMQALDDIQNNQYLEKQIYANPEAPYVGEWTAAVSFDLLSMKILKNGQVLACGSNPNSGEIKGKVYSENGDVSFIFESGTRYTVISVDKAFMMLEAYGKDYKFHAGEVSERCIEKFKEFN